MLVTHRDKVTVTSVGTTFELLTVVWSLQSF